MKKSRKLMSILLVVAMLFTLAAPAFAANTSHTITITNETSGHTYTAYQVFSGDIEILDGKEVLTNIAWGNGVNGQALLEALTNASESAYVDCETAEDVANVLKEFGDDSAELDAFAKIVGNHLAIPAGQSTESGGNKAYSTLSKIQAILLQLMLRQNIFWK